MKFYRIPEAGFANMKDYPFRSNYIHIDGMRMHYVDEGPADAKPVLMLHGEPSWSYLYRHMIPVCASAGHRVIAPDFIGFGKSDKPARVSDHSYQAHMDWMTSFITTLDLKDITLFGQDWGALIGLRLAAEQEDRFAGLVISNGMLLTGDQKVPAALKIWIAIARFSPWLPIHRIINFGCKRVLDKEEKRAYKAPFLSSKYMAGVRAFPALVPVTPQNPATPANRAAWKVLEKWNKPFLTVFSDADPFTRGGDDYLQNRIPGSKGQKHCTLRGGHFLQEDRGDQLARIINQFIHEMQFI
jgi:haloalkane dehalogenase